MAECARDLRNRQTLGCPRARPCARRPVAQRRSRAAPRAAVGGRRRAPGRHADRRRRARRRMAGFHRAAGNRRRGRLVPHAARLAFDPPEDRRGRRARRGVRLTPKDRREMVRRGAQRGSHPHPHSHSRRTRGWRESRARARFAFPLHLSAWDEPRGPAGTDRQPRLRAPVEPRRDRAIRAHARGGPRPHRRAYVAGASRSERGAAASTMRGLPDPA